MQALYIHEDKAPKNEYPVFHFLEALDKENSEKPSEGVSANLRISIYLGVYFSLRSCSHC